VKYPLKKRSTRFLSRILSLGGVVEALQPERSAALEIGNAGLQQQCNRIGPRPSLAGDALRAGLGDRQNRRELLLPAGHRQKGSVLGEDSPIKQVTAATKNASFRCIHSSPTGAPG
jgi:hypothetical protein